MHVQKMTATQTTTRRIVGELSCQQDSYLRSLNAHVISCVPYSRSTDAGSSKTKAKKSIAVPSKTSWLVECDDSVLFPEGGGQPTDHGTLVPLDGDSNDPIKIELVERQGLQCVIHSSQPLAPGVAVRQEVDFERRWDLMQQHTGQHLLSAILNKYDKLQTLGWGMGAEGEMSYVDLPRKPTDEELQTIQAEVNEVIQQNLTITIDIPTNANTNKMPDDYDQERGVVRVIKIGDLDNNTCCGTHLQQTSHIGLLLLGSNQAASGGRTRQSFIAGNRAIKYATSSLSTVRSLARHLSTSTSSTDLLNTVTHLQDTVSTLKKKETKLQSEIATFEISRIKSSLLAKNSAFLHRPDTSLDLLNIVAAGIKDDIQGDNVVILASGEGSTGGAVIVSGGKSEAVAAHVAKIKEHFPAIKGGGKGERWQGKMPVWKNGDLDLLRDMVDA